MIQMRIKKSRKDQGAWVRTITINNNNIKISNNNNIISSNNRIEICNRLKETIKE
jgi:hypothetical protein